MVTLKDIAERCKVSVGSVSKALNNDTSKNNWIGAKTRARIKKVAQEMGYVADDMAKSIKTGRSRIISYVTRAINVDMFKGLSLEARPHDYVIEPFFVDSSDSTHLQQLLDHIIKRRIAGVCICYDDPSAALLVKELNELKIPCALSAELHDRPENICFIESNQQKGMKLIADYLYECGHRKICHVGMSWFRDTALKDVFKNKDEECQVESVMASDEALRNGVRRIMADPSRRPSALCFTERAALIICLTDLYNNGYKIPDDISVISYGDFNYSHLMGCPLTVIREDSLAQGCLTFRKLLEMIESRTQLVSEELCDVELIVRDSVARI